ncbi:RAE1-like protein isoform X2 [Tanacetum coccineum]
MDGETGVQLGFVRLVPKSTTVTNSPCSAQDSVVAQDGYDNVCGVGPSVPLKRQCMRQSSSVPCRGDTKCRIQIRLQCGYSSDAYSFGEIDKKIDTGNIKKVQSSLSENGSLTMRFLCGSLAVVAALHSRIRRFEDKLMDLKPHKVAVLAEEQTKTAKKENLDNKRQRIFKIFRMLLDLLRTRVNLEANVLIFEKDQYLCIIELAIIYSRQGQNLKTIPRKGRIRTGQDWIIKDHYNSEVIERATRYWDLRQQTPVHTQQLPKRCNALSVKHPLMVVGTTDRNLIAFNLQNQVQHTFATLGSDGAFNFWDKDSKQ